MESKNLMNLTVNNFNTPIFTLQVLSQILLNSPNRLQLIRVLPTEQMLVPLVQGVLASQKSSLAELLPLMGTLLQYTDALNFSIMCKIRMLRDQSHALISTMV